MSKLLRPNCEFAFEQEAHGTPLERTRRAVAQFQSLMENRPVHCISCAALNPAEGNFCFNCGAKLFKGERLQDKLTMTNGLHDAPSDADDTIKAGMTVEDVERRLILKTLASVKNNKTRAAAMLGISLKTLHNKLNEYRLGSDSPERP